MLSFLTLLITTMGHYIKFSNLIGTNMIGTKGADQRDGSDRRRRRQPAGRIWSALKAPTSKTRLAGAEGDGQKNW